MQGVDYQGNLVDEFKKLNTIGHMGHFRLYSYGEVRDILIHHGFEIVGRTHGGRLKHDSPDDWQSLLCRSVVPELMHAQLYIIARKPLRTNNHAVALISSKEST